MSAPATTNGESGGYVRSDHSPFGIIWRIATSTGWSVEYAMWQVPFATLQMMIADVPRYVTGVQKRKLDSEEELRKFVDNFYYT